MSTTIQSRLKKAGRWLPVALLPLLPFAAQAQALNYSAAGASNVTPLPTYTSITGTPITTTSTDDANSADQPIGFTFNFNGMPFTRFVLNTNGFIKLGTTAPSAAAMFLPATGGTNIDPFQSPNPADVNIVAPFNVDLDAGNGTGGATYSVTTTGTAPNQVCVIQWKNVKDKTGGQFANFSFQVKLYETTNTVEFTYDAPVVSAATPAFQFSQAGIKGSGFAAGQFVQVLKQSGAAWNAATFANSLTGTSLNTLNYRNNVNPVAGTTYRFAPTVANDGAVTLIYTQGQLATFSPAHVVRARISNVGTSPYTGTATLTVKRGATTLFTDTKPVTTLANGAAATVAFAAYDAATMANLGTNDVSVVLGADDNAGNNSKTLDQVVSATTVNYSSPATATTGGISFGATGMGNAGSRFTTTAPRLVTSIQAYLASGTGTVAGVLFDATGAELGRSATRTLVAGDAGTLVTFTLTTPVNISAGDFFAGLNLAAGAAVGSQEEVPTRAATFYQINTGPTLVDLASNNLGRFNIGAITAASTATCAPVTALAAGTITNTTANVTFTAPAGATGYVVTYTPAGGTATTVTPAPTASPVSLTGLTAGTTYTVSVTNNCGTGSTSAAVTTTFTTTGAAPGPANDNCANATALTVGATCTNTLGTNAGATASTAPIPAPSCGGATLGPLADVWYTVTVPASGNLSVTTSAVTGSLLDDTVLELYSGACGALTSLGCNDDDPAGSDGFSKVSLTGQTPGAVLYVRVRSYGTSATGQFNICATSSVPCGDPSAATIGGATNTSLQITFTPGAGNTSYNVTYTSGGAVTTVTPAPTTSPITITGLQPGTSYTITIQGVCANGLGAVLTGSATTTGTPPAATYATLPYAENFEGPWVNGLSTRDLPTANWRNSPATGDRSWRRDDDGVSANWRYLPAGAYTPAFSTGAHSARFHTYGAGPSGAQGTMDLYVNMNTTGNKTLSFDYINPTGTDKLEVLLSTDGGATFGATPILTGTTSTTFTAKTVAVNSNSATTVIRFRATSDFDADDLGIDNLRLAVVSATTNTALAATVSLYPNPAHQSFQLNVPTGLRNASASLSNALGQVVQSRELNLPVAGGTATFNVSNLAAGVYTLTLKSGTDLVVKRVVVE